MLQMKESGCACALLECHHKQVSVPKPDYPAKTTHVTGCNVKAELSCIASAQHRQQLSVTSGDLMLGLQMAASYFYSPPAVSRSIKHICGC